jgi:hypothetical protein
MFFVEMQFTEKESSVIIKELKALEKSGKEGLF